MAMNIEVFTGSCYLCKETICMVKKVIGHKCILRIYNLAEKQGIKEARKYQVRTVPTIVGNRRKMFEGVPDYSKLVKCSIEHGCKGRLLERKTSS